MTAIQETAGNKTLSKTALDMARRQPDHRAAWLCCAAALGQTSSLRAARAALAGVGLPEVRALALQLIDQLAHSDPN